MPAQCRQQCSSQYTKTSLIAALNTTLCSACDRPAYQPLSKQVQAHNPGFVYHVWCVVLLF